MRIIICGGGGLGHTCAGVLSNHEGITVDMLTNRPEKWSHTFKVNTPDKGTIIGKLDRISSKPADLIPDTDIPWLKSAGMPYFDFGSGNLNHLIPRMKFFVAEKFGIDNLNDIDITLVASHFHDVVISKEGHTEGVKLLLSIKYQGKELDIDPDEVYKASGIPMPTDQKRNMMNASSNFDIIYSILSAIREKKSIKIHTPGVDGHIGGYPFIIDGSGNVVKGYMAPNYSLEEMEKVNYNSIYRDGIENVEEGCLVYSDELIKKVKTRFGIDIPKRVPLDEANEVANLLIDNIINVNLQ